MTYNNNFWDERYSSNEYIYGTEPNLYLAEKLKSIKPNSFILFPCEGEGRNAVYALRNNFSVLAFDSSQIGKLKAEKLAHSYKVAIDYQIVDVENFTFQDESFDCIAVIYAHFAETIRKNIHQKFSKMLKSGGYLIMEVFNKKQIQNSSGGPKDISMLYNLDDLLSDYNDFEFLEAYETQTILEEGDYHKGNSDVIRIFAQKK